MSRLGVGIATELAIIIIGRSIAIVLFMGVLSMEIKVTCSDNRVLVWHYEAHNTIDKMVEAIKENLSNWQTIEIKIENKS